jgi:hypothetical protein
VLLGDTPVRSLGRRAVARRIALVPQDLHVPFPFRAGELVLMGRAPHQPLVGLDSDADVARARTALARLGIEDLADRSVETLSGGERQLVLFARALVQDPGLLLLDEPTAFLDLKHRLEVLREVRRFVAAGRGALVVSHDLTPRRAGLILDSRGNPTVEVECRSSSGGPSAAPRCRRALDRRRTRRSSCATATSPLPRQGRAEGRRQRQRPRSPRRCSVSMRPRPAGLDRC